MDDIKTEVSNKFSRLFSATPPPTYKFRIVTEYFLISFSAKMLPVILLAVVAEMSAVKLHTSFLPEFDTEQWWGVGEKCDTDDTSIRKFEIEFNHTMVTDLKQRLKNRRPLTPTLDGLQSQDGINSEYLEQILQYWMDGYDFQKRQNVLNSFPRFKTKIQGLDIHFIWQKPQNATGKKVVPLLMLHGWPSSSWEFYKVIPILTTPNKDYDFVFEVIAADLPGFGFSEGTTKPGLSPAHIGIILRNLMIRLGFEKFYIQAGDWGSQAASHLATIFPNNILGFHVNMPVSFRPITLVKMLFGSMFPSYGDPVLANRTYPLSRKISGLLYEGGYYLLQATKPDTVGVALTDSPAGLAAYLMEKLGVGANSHQRNTKHGGLANYDIDDILDTVTIVWVNNCIVTSMRIYREAYRRPEIINKLENTPTKVPTAAINFRHEILYQSMDMLQDKYPNLLRSTVFEFGGHFAGLLDPEVLSQDVFDSVEDFMDFRYNKL